MTRGATPNGAVEIKSKKGGARAGCGRKPGIPNKRTARVMLEVARTGITPLDYMLSVMRDVKRETRERLAAAASAAPYVHAKLSSVEMNAKVVSMTLAQEIAALNVLTTQSDADSD